MTAEKESEVISFVIGLLTMIGVLVTAWATMRQFRLAKRTHALASPTITATVIRMNTSGPYPIQFKISLDETDRKSWAIESILVWPPWRPLIAEIASFENDVYGNPAHHKPERWTRRIKFDPPIQSKGLLVAASTPSVLGLRCTLSSRVNPNIKSKCATRFRIKD